MSKLYALFACLDRVEKISLRRWLHSPLHLRHEQVRALLLFLLDNPSADIDAVEPEILFGQLYPGEPYDDLRWRHLRSLALKNLEAFVRFLDWGREENQNPIPLARSYRIRRLPDRARQLLVQATGKLPQATDNHYRYRYELERERFELEGTGQRTAADNLFDMHQALTHFYLLKTLEHALVHRSHENLRRSGSAELTLLPSVLAHIEHAPQRIPSDILLYYYGYRVLEQPGEQGFFEQLRSLWEKHEGGLSPGEQKRFYRIILNYYIRQINSGTQGALRQAADWYERGLNARLLDEPDGYLSRFAYKNLTAIWLRLGELKRAEDFVLQAASRLNPNHSTVYLHYNQAKLHMAHRRYHQAMQLLARLEYDDWFMATDSNVMLLKMYYELGEWDLLDALLRRFRTFLRRKTGMSYHRDNYTHIVRLTRRLLDLPPGNTAARLQLHQDICNTNPLTEKDWLLEQLEGANK